MSWRHRTIGALVAVSAHPVGALRADRAMTAARDATALIPRSRDLLAADEKSNRPSLSEGLDEDERCACCG